MLTTWTFWVGAVWGFAAGVLVIWHTLVRPMARLLGIDKAAEEDSGEISR